VKQLLTTSFTETEMGDTSLKVSKSPNLLGTENVNFVDGEDPWTYEVPAIADPTTKLSGFQDADLGRFLSRPVKIKEYQWTPASALTVTRFNPWTEFFANLDVLEKINRYRNLRCNLKMKVLVNGNSFYYGRALCTYNPFVTSDEITVNRTFVAQDLIQASQKPHLLLDPTTSQGGVMTLPFIWPENYLDVTKAGWPDEMGEVDIHDFDTLNHANGGTDPISVVIFVWAENVTLAVPTTSVAQSGVVTSSDLDEQGFPKPYVTQAGGDKPPRAKKLASNTDTSDEFAQDGLISKPASAVAKLADTLSMIPIIGPYAKATSLVSSRIGDVARIFGYSRPQILSDTSAYVPRYLGNLANADAPENLVKLSLDSKNELSIDTRVMGLGGEDELTVNSICQRWSYWRQFDWPEAAVTDTMLTSMIVTPLYGDTLLAAPVTEIHSTALAFGASPFDAWQGSIKFRFNIVCSEYHRGRLRIVYNPTTSPAGAIPYNQVYSTIVDISKDRDFEYEVKWADIRAWAQNIGISGIVGSTLYDDVNPVLAGGVFDNGSLSVYVVNELATPSTAPADIKVQVWVKGGDDFAVSVPTTKNLSTLSVFKQQSELAPEVIGDSDEGPNSPTSVCEVASFAPGESINDDNQYLVYQGERIVSFREMLRRYHYWNSYYPAETGSGVRVVSQNVGDFPFYRGWEPSGQDLATGTLGPVGYNFCTETLLNYLTPAFALRRGGLRHKLLFSQVGGSTRSPVLSVSRHNLNGADNSVSTHPQDNALLGDRRKEMQETERSSLGGTAFTPTFNNPALEYETPFYTNGQRFLPGRYVNTYGGPNMAHEFSVDVPTLTSGNAYRVDKFVSVAEDFQLGFFVGAPIMYSYADPAAA